jgi:hypothetical protein
MNCHHCEKEIPHGQAVLVWEPDEMTKRFCDLECISAWLGPDRPLSRRVEAAKKGGSAPQPVVVGIPSIDRYQGNSPRNATEALGFKGVRRWR